MVFSMRKQGAPFVEMASSFDMPGDNGPDELSGSVGFEIDDGMPSASGDDAPMTLNIEDVENGSMMDAGMPPSMPAPHASRALMEQGTPQDLPPAMPNPKFGTSATVEYWGVESPSAKLVTDGEGAADDEHAGHDGASSHHQHNDHEDSHHDHKEESHHNHKEESHPDNKERSHHGSGAQQNSGHERHQHENERGRNHREDHGGQRGQHERENGKENGNDRIDQNRNDRGDDRSRGGGQAHQQDADNNSDRSSPHPVIIINEEADSKYQAATVAGGLIAIFAQAYLWGNVFVTLFKPQRRAAASADIAVNAAGAAPQGPAPNAAPAMGAEAQAALAGMQDRGQGPGTGHRIGDTSGGPAARPSPEQVTSAPSNRFSGASGRAGTQGMVATS